MSQDKQINREACEWISKMHDAGLQPSEEQALQQWMQQSPVHKAELKRMAKRWEQLNVLTELAVPQASRSVAAKPWYLHWGGAVATAAILLVLTVIIQPFNSAPAKQVYTTSLGEQREIILSDQSVVMLNTSSAIQVEYTKGSRSIQLVQGEAHFDVAHNPDRPFRVQAGKSIVRAVGTAFSVHLTQQTVDVLVTEGTVEMTALQTRLPASNTATTDPAPNPTPRAVINAGAGASFNQRLDAIELAEGIGEAEIGRKLSWREGMVRFSDDALKDVVAEVSRYTPVNIVILDPELQNLRIGGVFKVGETQKMFEALEQSFGIKAEKINEKLIHLTAVKQAEK